MPTNWERRARRAEGLSRALCDRCEIGLTKIRRDRELVALVFRMPALRPWLGSEYLAWASAFLVTLATYAGQAGDEGSQETLLRAASVLDAVLVTQE